jgi:hypothetical protein
MAQALFDEHPLEEYLRGQLLFKLATRSLMQFDLRIWRVAVNMAWNYAGAPERA